MSCDGPEEMTRSELAGMSPPKMKGSAPPKGSPLAPRTARTDDEEIEPERILLIQRCVRRWCALREMARRAALQPSPEEQMQRHAAAFFVLQGLVLAIIMAFSSVGFGRSTIRALSHPAVQWLSEQCVVAALVLLVPLYLLDFSYWSSPIGVGVRRAAYAFTALTFVATVFADANADPAAAMGLCIFVLPLAALGIRNTLLWYESTVHALRALSHGLYAAAALALGVWAIWLARGNLWTSENTARWSAELDCDSRADMHEGYEICAAVLILWTAPLCVGGASLLFAVSLALLGRTLARTTQWVRGMVKAVIALVILLTLGLYVAAAIGGAGMGMARQVFFVIGATLFGLLLVGGVVVGRKALRTELITQPLYRSLIEMLDSDGARATLLYIGAPLIVGGAVLSALNQLTRRLTRFYFYQPICFYSRRPSLAGQQGPLRTYGPCTALLTPTFADRFNALGEWSWTPLLLIICYLAIGCWALLYGTTLSYMVFAVCINILKSMHWVLASIIFFLFGQVMFLIPVVPGLAVYMCAGVLLVPACEQPFGGGTRGFWLAVAYASVLSFLMKLVAHVLQQKVVGETMGSSAKVRAEVGINSQTMKGIRHVLEQPGLSVGKCAIFLGGPDWPTSVLCGILKLNLCRMLLALQPIIVLSVPSTMAGAFQLKTDDGDVWASAASVSLALCSLIMLVAGLVAMYYIEDAKAHHKAALRAYEDDAEVAALEEEEKALKDRFAEATELSKMPPLPLLQLLCATATLALSSYGLMFASSACFENFSLTDDIADVLCVSCPRAAVKPAGWIALAMLGVGILCLVRFNEWSEQATMLTLTPSPTRRRISVQDGRISLV